MLTAVLLKANGSGVRGDKNLKQWLIWHGNFSSGIYRIANFYNGSQGNCLQNIHSLTFEILDSVPDKFAFWKANTKTHTSGGER